MTVSVGPWSPPIASTATRTGRSDSIRLTALRSTGGQAAPRSRRALRGRALVGLGLDVERLAAGVVAAVRAGVMLLLALVAVRTLVQPRQADREVAATLALSGVRDTPLRNTHGLSWLLSGYAPVSVGASSMRCRWPPGHPCTTRLTCGRRASG